MTLTIWKFDIPVGPDYSVEMPKGSRILKVADQFGSGDHISIWAQVRTDAEKELRTFRAVGTGHPLGQPGDDEMIDYLDSIVTLGGNFVWHIFEVR